MDNLGLLDSILSRKSVRRYAPTLETDVMGQVLDACTGTAGLVPDNRFNARVQALAAGGNVTSLLGAYGRLVTPPYVVIPTIQGAKHTLVDLGYHSQQIVIRLTQLGLGTCYIGTLSNDDKTRELFGISPEEQHASIIAFGMPSETFGGRLVNGLIHSAAGAGNKLATNRLYYDDLNQEPVTPPPSWAPLIEAARRAPSAGNAQPWRFLGVGNRLYLFALRHNARYGKGQGVAYKYLDSGICLANIMLAMQALGRQGTCSLCSDADEGVPEYPRMFQPIAELVLE